MSPQQTPHDVNWRGLSPIGRERLGRIGMRLSAGYSAPEIATLLEAEREQIEFLPLPSRGARITDTFVAAQLRALKSELLRVSSESE